MSVNYLLAYTLTRNKLQHFNKNEHLKRRTKPHQGREENDSVILAFD